MWLQSSQQLKRQNHFLEIEEISGRTWKPAPTAKKTATREPSLSCGIFWPRSRMGSVYIQRGFIFWFVPDDFLPMRYASQSKDGNKWHHLAGGIDRFLRRFSPGSVTGFSWDKAKDNWPPDAQRDSRLRLDSSILVFFLTWVTGLECGVLRGADAFVGSSNSRGSPVRCVFLVTIDVGVPLFLGICASKCVSDGTWIWDQMQRLFFCFVCLWKQSEERNKWSKAHIAKDDGKDRESDSEFRAAKGKKLKQVITEWCWDFSSIGLVSLQARSKVWRSDFRNTVSYCTGRTQVTERPLDINRRFSVYCQRCDQPKGFPHFSGPVLELWFHGRKANHGGNCVNKILKTEFLTMYCDQWEGEAPHLWRGTLSEVKVWGEWYWSGVFVLPCFSGTSRFIFLVLSGFAGAKKKWADKMEAKKKDRWSKLEENKTRWKQKSEWKVGSTAKQAANKTHKQNGHLQNTHAKKTHDTVAENSISWNWRKEEISTCFQGKQVNTEIMAFFE